MTLVEELVEKARELDATERFQLVNALLAQSTVSPEEHEAIWLEEVHARHEAYLAGKVQMVPLDEVLERIRNR